MNILATIFLLFIILFFIKMGKTSGKLTHWLLYIYLTVLVAATILVPFITDDTLSEKRVDQSEVDQVWNELDTKLSQGELDQVDPKFILAENSFDVSHLKTLQLRTSKENSIHVLVERKESNDNKMEAIIYRKGLIINEYDFSEVLKPYHLELADQTLKIISSQQRINLAMSSNPFPIRQFTGETMSSGHSSAHGHQVIYLRIPHDLEIVADEQIYLQVVGES